ncbi:DHA2 family efflux MFS transporter permease subunit [Paractinoplanes lichenicola]|uniref:DHA2 family efflux MFS transporter permease subunit n=1 Tax=Paractinoplanes lichenicola TaxID=2802976 RepID=A0ABS1VFE6_9ACTN|nr:DHA2 family efflux MFS transporter permease subunit [Actinoplanes lichenicola]MBL7253419.1 DHA2 family efflux MFS transporter permease subunit [Actinoplanes lichenicola]
MSTDTVAAGRGAAGAGKSPGMAILITGLASFMAGLDNLVVVTALPTIREKLGGSLEELEWTINAYTLSFAVLMMFGAALGDRFGRRRMFIAGLAVFAGASAAAALAPGINELIAARAVQGAGAAVVMPLSLTLLTSAVPAAKRGAALGIYGALNGLAIAGGPLIGGVVVQHVSWQWIFWINVPVALVLAPLAWRRLAESRGPNNHLDLPGTVLVSLGILGLVFGLIRANGHGGWTDPQVLGSLAGGAVLLFLFVQWERRTSAPMLPMSMFRNRAFSAVNAGGLLMSAGMYGVVFLITQFMQTIQLMSPTEAGVRMLAWTAMPLLVAPVAGILSDKLGGRPVVVFGLSLMAAAFAYWALIMTPDASYALQLPGYILGGVGIACFFAPLLNLTMSSVAVAEQGIASGSTSATRELGAALGVAALASVFTHNGGYASGQDFVDGFVPALWVGSAALVLAAIVMSFAKRPASLGEQPVVAADSPELTPETVGPAR